MLQAWHSGICGSLRHGKAVLPGGVRGRRLHVPGEPCLGKEHHRPWSFRLPVEA
nr:MAG TPA: hypothetical protein [Caudoviricetes sp.]